MANPSKRKGTAAETAVVDYLRRRGWPHAERRALNGNLDKGDLAGVIGFTGEVKNCRTIDLAGWCDELATEMRNTGDLAGAVIAKRVRKADPADWYAVMPLRVLVDLLHAAGYGDPRLDQEAS